MSGLASTQERPTNLETRHAPRTTRNIRSLSWSFFIHDRWKFLPMVLSDYGREILRRKYGAIATDRSYENKASGLFGPIGKAIDRKVLDLPPHQALRDRLDTVVGHLKSEITERSGSSSQPVRVLSAPCGLSRDVITAVSELREESPDEAPPIHVSAIDLDDTDEVLDLAARRASERDVDIEFIKASLFDYSPEASAVEDSQAFHIVNCIGFTPWLTLPDLSKLAKLFHDELMVPDGTLIIDLWAWHETSVLGRQLDIDTIYHDRDDFVGTLNDAGFELVDNTPTPNKVLSVMRFRSV